MDRRVTSYRRGRCLADLAIYAYDGAGNRTRRSGETTTTYTYNDADQLTSRGATHDGNGNLTATSSYGLSAATYNATEQPTSLTPAGGRATSQSYAGATQSQWRTSRLPVSRR